MVGITLTANDTEGAHLVAALFLFIQVTGSSLTQVFAYKFIFWKTLYIMLSKGERKT
ncbi:hypothetical protein QFZ81_004018 [Paenibacillus sp. V4I9]|nr:hypothetical protein [Paenibacillus sp. V4I9]